MRFRMKSKFRNIIHGWENLPIQTKIFLLVGLFFGIGFVFASPPMKSPDEPQHYYRSYEVSDFDFVSDKYSDGRYGYKLPDNIAGFGEQSLIREEKHLPPDTAMLATLNEQTYSPTLREIRFENSAVYSPVGYLASAMGVGISRVLKLSVLQGYYLGRIFNLLTYIGLVALGITMARTFRWTLLSIALLPMTLFQAASFSPDATTFGLAFLCVGLLLNVVFQIKIQSRYLWAILCALVLVGLTKQVYVLLLIPFLFIPKNRFGSIRRYWLCMASFILIPFLFTGLWLALTFGISEQLRVMFQLGDGVSAVGQIKYVLVNPFSYAKTIVVSLFGSQSDYLLKGTVGLLGWATISLPLYVYLMIAVNLFLSVVIGESFIQTRQKLSQRIKLSMLLTGLLLILAICTSLYVSFTPVGASVINGLQGRYFIPALLLLVPLLSLIKLSVKTNARHFAVAQTCLIVLILSSSLLVLVKETFLKA